MIDFMLKKLHCGLLKFLELDMFFSYFGLLEKRSGSSLSRIDGDEDDDMVTNNDRETSLEREILEETERDPQARVLERI